MNGIVSAVCKTLNLHDTTALLAIQLVLVMPLFFVRKGWKIFQKRVRAGQCTKARDKAFKRVVENYDFHELLGFQKAPLF
ncbi:hypothetical protein [Bartonella machadoae]|uniref:hypothetical protein n=1 Tax=Bartonella machadoae TaxID=2893471 RepID=UPI001F4D19EE|nr:hypothetical protein [Bartonella machadoae]UNE53952.1 hypothetical protein LNM86_10275 [Bartonella machadoae]